MATKKSWGNLPKRTLACRVKSSACRMKFCKTTILWFYNFTAEITSPTPPGRLFGCVCVWVTPTTSVFCLSDPTLGTNTHIQVVAGWISWSKRLPSEWVQHPPTPIHFNWNGSCSALPTSSLQISVWPNRLGPPSIIKSFSSSTSGRKEAQQIFWLLSILPINMKAQDKSQQYIL